MSGERCDEHDWSDDYICRDCGVVKVGRAPWWLWVLPAKKAGLTNGQLRVLLALWTFADLESAAPYTISPSMRDLRTRMGGLGASTIREHLAGIRATGWAREATIGGRRAFELAWAEPFPLEERTRTDAPGQLYVCLFSNGRIKIGKTATPERRVASHEKNARAFGHSLQCWWASLRVDACGAAEARALALVREIAKPVTGNEWFTGADFREVVRRVAAACEEVDR